MSININTGAFVPTTDVFDTQSIYTLDINSQEFKEFLVRLRQNVNNLALVLNIKDTGYYVDTEFVNGQVYFPNPALSSLTSQNPTLRQVYRKLVIFGQLPNSTSKSVAHGIANINSQCSSTRIYGAATDTTGLRWIPLDYASASGTDNIQVDITSTDVVITTASNRSNYNISYVVIEYLKQ